MIRFHQLISSQNTNNLLVFILKYTLSNTDNFNIPFIIPCVSKSSNDGLAAMYFRSFFLIFVFSLSSVSIFDEEFVP